MSLESVALLSEKDRQAYADRLARELMRPVPPWRPPGRGDSTRGAAIKTPKGAMKGSSPRRQVRSPRPKPAAPTPVEQGSQRPVRTPPGAQDRAVKKPAGTPRKSRRVAPKDPQANALSDPETGRCNPTDTRFARGNARPVNSSMPFLRATFDAEAARARSSEGLW